ncbi:MAG: YagK/YfjJ domain-containing protein [Pseudomonadota bacterium]
MFTNCPKRHPHNTKLRLCYDNWFQGLPVQQREQGPQIENYLETTLRVLQHTTYEQNRTLAFRLDLRFPQAMPVGPIHADNACLNRFFYALRKELDAAGTKYQTKIRYLWAREQDTSDKPHYHLMLLLNYDAFCSLGCFSPSFDGGYEMDNLYHRCVRAWSWAIGWPMHDMAGRVHVATDKLTQQPYVYRQHRDDAATFALVFYAASYLCKAYSKPIAQGIRCHQGSSR